jgi:hypothetical protein
MPGNQKGFFASLLDFSFSSLITTRIIKIVYVIGTIVISLVFVGFLVEALNRGGGDVLAGIIGAPIGWVLYMIFFRMGLEFIIVIFGIGEDVRQIANRPGAGVNISPPPGVDYPASPPPSGVNISPPPGVDYPASPSPLPDSGGSLFCGACGSALRPSAKFCQSCSAPVSN